MKKILFVLIAVILSTFGNIPVFADRSDISDHLKLSLLDHVETGVEFTTKGRTQLELLDSFSQIFHFNNGYLIALDGGVSEDTIVRCGENRVHWTAGGHIHLSPIIKKYVVFSSYMKFLNSLEINPRYSYDFSDHHTRVGLSLALAFGLQPL